LRQPAATFAGRKNGGTSEPRHKVVAVDPSVGAPIARWNREKSNPDRPDALSKIIAAQTANDIAAAVVADRRRMRIPHNSLCAVGGTPLLKTSQHLPALFGKLLGKQPGAKYLVAPRRR
jgi:hypothetical protein